jgi:hypothetical protein
MDEAELEPYDDLPLELFTADPIFKGVFLDQGFPFYDPPYYTVAAPDQTIDGVTYFLGGWSSENNSAEFQNASAETTAVIFRQPNAVVTAHMKGHLLTNTPDATAHNNGRRVVQTTDGKWHLVYEDDGKIWYTVSTDNGQTWSPEEKLNTNNDLNDSPSIVTNGNLIGVVWNHYNGVRHRPVLRHRRGPGIWTPELTLLVENYYSLNRSTRPALVYAQTDAIPWYYILYRVNARTHRMDCGCSSG